MSSVPCQVQLCGWLDQIDAQMSKQENIWSIKRTVIKELRYHCETVNVKNIYIHLQFYPKQCFILQHILKIFQFN